MIGPLFAAFTGLAFKEGACYGKPEAFFLFLMTPIMCLGHLTGLASGEVETFFVATWMLGFLVFAGRKYTQAVKDDIGDKSVFTFRGLKTDQERRDYLEKQGKKTLNFRWLKSRTNLKAAKSQKYCRRLKVKTSTKTRKTKIPRWKLLLGPN